MSRPVWLLLAPVLFLILWSGGYVVAKVGLLHAAPMAILAIRYACVIVIMTVLFVIFRPPLPTKHIDWLHLAIVGILIQTVYFGLTYLAFVNGVAAGTAALMMILQPILVALIAPRWSGERIGWRQYALGKTLWPVASSDHRKPNWLCGWADLPVAIPVSGRRTTDPLGLGVFCRDGLSSHW
jgi:drug/metabolite transporter (DMT)-like permease